MIFFVLWSFSQMNKAQTCCFDEFKTFEGFSNMCHVFQFFLFTSSLLVNENISGYESPFHSLLFL